MANDSNDPASNLATLLTNLLKKFLESYQIVVLVLTVIFFAIISLLLLIFRT